MYIQLASSHDLDSKLQCNWYLIVNRSCGTLLPTEEMCQLWFRHALLLSSRTSAPRWLPEFAPIRSISLALFKWNAKENTNSCKQFLTSMPSSHGYAIEMRPSVDGLEFQNLSGWDTKSFQMAKTFGSNYRIYRDIAVLLYLLWIHKWACDGTNVSKKPGTFGRC